MVLVFSSIVDFGSLYASSISVSSGTSTSHAMISWASSCLGGEVICLLWSSSNSPLLWVASFYAEHLGYCSWVLILGTSSIVLFSEALGSRLGIFELGLGDSLVACGGFCSTVSGWSSCIESEVVV
jgi:hypothetical protein